MNAAGLLNFGIKPGKWRLAVWGPALESSLFIACAKRPAVVAECTGETASNMGKHMVFSLLLVFILACSSLAHRKLLLLLIDGFRHDYISDDVLDSLPGFQEIVNCGVKVDYMTPDFPSLSYPNYYTLMTGKYMLWFFLCVLLLRDSKQL